MHHHCFCGPLSAHTTAAPTTTEATTTAAPTTEAPLAEEVSVEEAPATTAAPATTTEASKWKGVIDIGFGDDHHADLRIYTDKEKFNALAADATYIRYTTNEVTAVYKRKTCWKDLDAHDLFLSTWSVKGNNVFHEDFDIFNNYEDAVADRNPWQYCNGDDKGVGFPRDCAEKKHTIFRWFAFPKNDVPETVEFQPRFDRMYLSKNRKCYQEARFEILEGSAPECPLAPVAETEAPTTAAPTTTEAATTAAPTTEAPATTTEVATTVPATTTIAATQEEASVSEDSLSSVSSVLEPSESSSEYSGAHHHHHHHWHGHASGGWAAHGHHHHHHHHYGGFKVFSNCGINRFYRNKRHFNWAKDLFSSKDDMMWLSGLLEKKEIDSEQYEFLKQLFLSKSESQEGETHKWWSNHFTKKMSSKNVDAESMPAWLKEHSQKEKKFEWSTSWSHSGENKDEVLKKSRESAAAAKENLAQEKSKFFQKFGDAAEDKSTSWKEFFHL
jgi:hypothetical protein